MTGDDRFAGTIDWDSFWAAHRESDLDPGNAASVSQGKEVLLERFIDRTGVPDRIAVVGCGPGHLPAALARSYPDTAVVGYDAARSIVRRNRRDYADLENLEFEEAVLPAFDVADDFDLVYSYATVHYVEAALAAIEAMYAALRTGGYLIVNYPNEKTRAVYAQAEDPQLVGRFAAVIAGESVLSAEQIATALDRDVRDFWAEIDADGPFVRETNPCVVVGR